MTPDELYPYQKEGVEWLKTKRFALLADEMGLGKSAQVIVAADSIRGASMTRNFKPIAVAGAIAASLEAADATMLSSAALRSTTPIARTTLRDDSENVAADSNNRGAELPKAAAAGENAVPRLLILCPAVARYNWANECAKFSPQRQNGLVLLNSTQLPKLMQTLPFIYTTICSYDLANTNSGFLKALCPDILVLDETHYLKDPEAQRTAAVFGAGGIARHSGRTWALSGTPAPNHAAELWVLLRCFGLTPLSYEQYVERYCLSHYTRHGTRITGTRRDRIPELSKILAPLMLRRRKAEVLKDMPAISYGSVVVEQGIAPSLSLPFSEEGKLTRLTAAVESGADISKLSDALSSYRRYVGLLKVKNTALLVAGELECGLYEKIVIFGHHTVVLESLKDALRSWNPVLIKGSTLPKIREQHIQRFQFDPECRVFIGNIQAAGTAINLTAASNVLMLEPDWVPGNNAQAIARCHRIGQAEPVMVRFVELAGDSLDRKIMAVVARKTRELTKLFGD